HRPRRQGVLVLRPLTRGPGRRPDRDLRRDGPLVPPRRGLTPPRLTLRGCAPRPSGDVRRALVGWWHGRRWSDPAGRRGPPGAGRRVASRGPGPGLARGAAAVAGPVAGLSRGAGRPVRRTAGLRHRRPA